MMQTRAHDHVSNFPPNCKDYMARSIHLYYKYIYAIHYNYTGSLHEPIATYVLNTDIHIIMWHHVRMYDVYTFLFCS